MFALCITRGTLYNRGWILSFGPASTHGGWITLYNSSWIIPSGQRRTLAEAPFINRAGQFPLDNHPRWTTVTEIRLSSVDNNLELSEDFLFLAWSKLEHSSECFNYCQGICISSLASTACIQLCFYPVVFNHEETCDLNSESDPDLWFDDLCWELIWCS